MIPLINSHHGGGTLLNGLQNWWKCDESSGDLLDAHGSKAWTHMGSTAPAVAGKIGTARYLSGSAHFLTANEALAASSFTFAFWVNLYSVAPQTLICQWNSTGSAASWWIGVNGRFRITSHNGGNTILDETTVTVNNIHWFHVVAGLQHGSHLFLSVNGSPKKTIAAPAGISSQTSDWCIGWYNNSTGTDKSYATMDEVARWNRELTQPEINQLHSGVLTYEDL